ncbi:MAG: MFS transporter [Actinomycetota bacterium]
MHTSYEGLDRPGGFSRSGLLAPLKERNFRLLWAGMTVSLLGDGISLLALAWAAYEITDSPIGLSMVMLAMTVPHVALLLFGGVASDRLRKRFVMLASDLMRGAVVGTIGFLALADALTIPRLAALAAVYGAGSAFFGPSFDAIVPEVVPASQLGQANSLDQLVKPLALRLAGPAVGGWLIAIGGTGVAFLVDAATFGISAIALMLLRLPKAQVRKRASVLTEMKEGLTYVRSHVWLWGTFGAATVAYLLFMGPVEVLLPHIVKVELGGSAGALGLVFAFGGLGSVGAATWVGRHGLPRRIVTLIYVCWTLSTLAIAGYGLGRSLWQLIIPCIAFNMLESVGTIGWMTLKQRHVPPGLLGRVSSLDWLISIGLVPVSFALTGPAAALFGERMTLTGAGVLGAIVTMAAYFLPGMRAPELIDSRSGFAFDASLGSPEPAVPLS